MSRSVAILIVNGYDRRGRWGPFNSEEAQRYPWIELCLREVRRFSSGADYEILVLDNTMLEQHWRIMQRYGITKVFRPQSGGHDPSRPGAGTALDGVMWHGASLQYLVDRMKHDYEYFITLDTDAFPIRDGWIQHLTDLIDEGAALAGIYRDEFAPTIRPYIHVSCLCMRTDYYHSLDCSFVSRIAQDLGQNLTLQVQNDAAQYSGRVTSISPSADARSRVFTIEITLPNHKNTLKPGMIASVELGGRRETSQPSVPLSAIVPYPGESGQFAVVVAEEQSGQWKAHVRRVTVGATHGSSVSVTGVRTGEKVVAIGAQLLKDGDSLSVIP